MSQATSQLKWPVTQIEVAYWLPKRSYSTAVRIRQGSGLVHKGYSHKLTAADTLESEVSHYTLQALDCAAYLESEVSHWGLWLRLWLLIYITETLFTMAM